jgi:hypothetical protein
MSSSEDEDVESLPWRTEIWDSDHPTHNRFRITLRRDSSRRHCNCGGEKEQAGFAPGTLASPLLPSSLISTYQHTLHTQNNESLMIPTTPVQAQPLHMSPETNLDIMLSSPRSQLPRKACRHRSTERSCKPSSSQNPRQADRLQLRYELQHLHGHAKPHKSLLHHNPCKPQY